jgi:hypothetical protein
MIRPSWFRTVVTRGALATGLLALWPVVSEAILVSPHAVFIDARTRTAQVFLINTGTTAEECDIELKFGYPDTDSAGQIFVRLFDSTTADQPSAAGWVRAFPRRVVVQPGERQVVRLLAQPPAGLTQGEYWSRLIVTARGAQVGMAGADSTVRAGINLIVSTIISVTYRNGPVQTGVTLGDYAAGVQGDSLVVRFGAERQGNAAWLGTGWVRLKDIAGRTVKEWDTPMAVYYAVNRRMAFGLDSVPPGQYTVDFELNTERTDIPMNVVLPAAPVTRTSPVLAVGSR